MTELPDRLMKVSDVAEIFDVTSATVRVWIAEGILPAIKIGNGHYWRVYASEVTALAERKYGHD
jgi:excisionase family DNA binding protein